MYTVIFCGGQGSRLMEETKKIPKPLVKIGQIAIVEHIMNSYLKNGYKNFLLLTGYKHNEFIKYFKNHKKYNFIKNKKKNNLPLVKILFTGNNSNKYQRLLKAKKFLLNENDNQNFFLTYGDGLSNININKLFKFHKLNNSICTLTGVNPAPRYGLLKLKNNHITRFEEKKIIKSNFVNAGYMVLDKRIFKFINKKKYYDFEENLLPFIAQKKKLLCYKFNGFWYGMDTLRDKKYLNELYRSKKAPWI